MLEKVSPLIMQCFQDIETVTDVYLNRRMRRKISATHFLIQDYYKTVIEVVRTHRKNSFTTTSYVNQYIVGLLSKL